MRMTTRTPSPPHAFREDGFTMIFAIIILLISSLLVTAAFVAAKGDVKLTHTTTSQKKAYYAALAGIAAYKDHLSTSAYYWKRCPRIPTNEEKRETVKQSPQEEEKEKGSYQAEEYVVQTLPAESSSGEAEHTLAKCETGEQSPVQAKGAATGTFRIESTGFSGGEERHLIATFKNPGFLNYVYFSKYEVEDPTNFPENERVPTEACEHYYSYRSTHTYTFNGKTKELTSWCPPIEFAPEDELKGPVHTDDAAAVCDSGGKEPTFGRTTADKIEMNGGHYAASGCTNSADMVGTYTESGKELEPPESDSELLETAGKKLQGKTYIELKSGTPNTMSITTYNSKGEAIIESGVPFPENGVLYVENSSSGCPISYTPFNTDYAGETDCGTVYVKGTYSESLTIAAADDIVIDGNVETTHESSGKPTGDATLGLIATNFVRVYHPVKQGYETKNVKPATEAPVDGKCVKLEETSGKILRSTEVAEITATGLKAGDEVEGTGIEAGTTISEVKESEKKIKLSKAAKPATKELSATIINGSTEVEGVTTTELANGDEVEGSGIETGTTITEIKTGNKIKLSKAAKTAAKELSAKVTKSSKIVESITTTGLSVGEEVEGTETNEIAAGTTIKAIKATENKIELSQEAKKNGTKLKVRPSTEATKLKFYGETIKLKFPTGYHLNSTLDLCYKVESGYSEYIESENLYIEKCESGSTYTSKGYCEYEFTAKTCSKEAKNASGYLENLTIDAAILSTDHSFIVDNYLCGKSMGTLTLWGSLAQFWRGPVGTGNGTGVVSTGYKKNYNYDERLATNTPPEFLSPSTTSWTSGRVTAAPPGFEV